MILGLTGYSRVGKDTVADHLVRNHGYEKIAFATPLKRITRDVNPILGFDVRNPGLLIRLSEALEYLTEDQVKALYPEYVRILKSLGTEGIRQEDEFFWVKAASKQVVDETRNYVFTDVRFPNEALYIKGMQGQLWHVDRPGTGGDGHSSEQFPGYLQEDHFLYNDATIADLHEQIENILALEALFA